MILTTCNIMQANSLEADNFSRDCDICAILMMFPFFYVLNTTLFSYDIIHYCVKTKLTEIIHPAAKNIALFSLE